jgi:hypothetical protein
MLLTAGTIFASGRRRSATAYTCAKPLSTNSSIPVTVTGEQAIEIAEIRHVALHADYVSSDLLDRRG